MAQIHISDELDAELERIAGQDGCAKNEFVEDAISLRIGEHLAAYESEFSEAEIAKLRRGLDQLNGGEGITMEEVDAKFERWRQERVSQLAPASNREP
jgi:predicted transcriptional regulator